MSDFDNIGLPLPDSLNIDTAREWNNEEDFYSFFEANNVSLLSAIDILIKINTIPSMYALIRILCVESIISRLGWAAPSKKDISNLSAQYVKFNLFKAIKLNLLCVLDSGILVIDKLSNTPIKNLQYEDFYKAFERYAYRKRNSFGNKSLPYRKAGKKDNNTKFGVSGNVYDKHDYGLSDW